MSLLGTGLLMSGAGLMIAGIACTMFTEQPAQAKRVRKNLKSPADLASKFESEAIKAGPVAVRPKRQPSQIANAAKKSARHASRPTSSAVRPN